MSLLERRLSFYESRMIHGGGAIFVSCTILGSIDESTFERALSALVARYPQLRSRIVEEDGHYVLRVATPPPDLVVDVRAEGDGAFLDELNVSLDRERGLLRATLLRGDGRTTLVLAVDHAIVDGRSALALHQVLWEAYASLDEGKPVRFPVTKSLDPPVEELLAGRFSDGALAAFARQGPQSADHPQAATLPVSQRTAFLGTESVGYGFEEITLDSTVSARLFATAKREGMSVHSMLCGGALSAVRRQLEPATEPLVLTCGSPVNLRPRLSPPLPADVVIPCSGFSVGVVTATVDSDPVALGKEIGQQLESAVRAQVPERSILALPLMSSPFMQSLSVVISNSGQVPPPPVPSGLRVVDMKILSPAKGPILKLSVITIDGRLGIGIVYDTRCYTADQIGKLAAELRAVLASLCSPA
jgi:hypothetical protein